MGTQTGTSRVCVPMRMPIGMNGGARHSPHEDDDTGGLKA